MQNSQTHHKPKIIDEGLPLFFKQEIEAELERQRLEVMDATIFYVVNMLTTFFKTENLTNEKGVNFTTQPMVLIMAEAMRSALTKRTQLLRSIGDNSLYLTGFFPESLKGKVMDVSYYMRMGESAYSHLHQTLEAQSNEDSREKIFKELSKKFEEMAKVLSSISDKSKSTHDRGLIHLYEKWLSTKDQRASEILKDKGIQTKNI